MPSTEKNLTQIRSDAALMQRVEKAQILYGLAEIAAYTGFSISTVRRAIRQHDLKATTIKKYGKVMSAKSTVDMWLAKLMEKKYIYSE
jgi:predicted Ser/Thr protein kinase